MDALVDCLDRLRDLPLGTVVHIGPGDLACLQQYRALPLQRLVWLDGDPDTVADLRAAAADWPVMRIEHSFVAASDEELVWQRFNLHQMNGVLTPVATDAYYPGLRRRDTLKARAVALATWVRQAGLAPVQGRHHLLVIDQPGREASLLASLTDDALAMFDHLLFRGSREAFFEGGSTAAQTRQALASRGYRCLHVSSQDAPLWPAALLEFDVRAAELKRIGHELAQVSALLQARDAELLQARQALERAAAERVAQEQAWARQTAERETALEARAAEAQQAADLQRRLALERDGQLTALRAQLDKAVADAGQLASARDALAKDKATLAAARDEQARQAADTGKRLRQLEAELAETVARHRSLQEELIKAEGQVELISDLLLRD